MIFEEIVLYNFGIYKGRHVIKLSPPSYDKVIILLGGLNGSGKTTLLDALQLTLYGKFAKYSNRGSTNYFDYLGKMINYHADASNGAALELQFKHFRNGKEESIRVLRSWQLRGKTIKETVEVKRDGVLDSVITDFWYEYVEEFIPAQISNLFFFDGEKIEAFADQDKSAELLKTGIHALLGLDLVYRLSTDLLTVERKRLARLQSNKTHSNLKELEEELKYLETMADKNTQKFIEMQVCLEQLKKEQEKHKQDYCREGGELFEQRETIEAQFLVAQEKLNALQEELRDIAAGEAPLMMIQDLLRSTHKQALLENEAKHNQAFQKELENRDATLLELLKQHTANHAALTTVEAFFEEDKLKRQQFIQTKCYLNTDPSAFSHLQLFTKTQASIRKLFEQIEVASNDIDKYQQQLASIPDPESLSGIQAKLKNTQQEIQQLQSNIESLEQEQVRFSKKIARQQADLTTAYETITKEEFANEKSHYLIKHSKRVRTTLKKFGQAVTKKHIRRIEHLISDSFQQLIRKENFISQIEINPNDYTITLYTPSHEKVHPKSLSAGERQLLAVSILWGLSRASGRPLPAIIDTPLSRLDGNHRQNLVDSYFHQASHQVILLSTDEEINQKYYADLKSAIGREYRIIYEKDKQSSVVKSGYFF